jgi:threonine aldolase
VITSRWEFASDNTAGICPEALAALQEANSGSAASYGEDEWTARLCHRVREIFEVECEVFLVLTGTAANALALAQLCQPFHSLICHEHAHIENDECGAVEFVTRGSKLIATAGANGKLDLREMEKAVARQHDLHSHKPRVVSLTQATELGTVYRPDELRELSAFARSRGMLVHMDGARFANAVASLRCTPRQITCEAGVDVLCFGGTKNGLAGGELVVFFNRDCAAEFDYRAKQMGQLASKMRVLAAPWLSLLENDLWLRNATRANAAAQTLANMLSKAQGDVTFPVDSSAVFVRMTPSVAAGLEERGWRFYKFIEPDTYRFMCSWATRDAALTELARDFAAARSCAEQAA